MSEIQAPESLAEEEARTGETDTLPPVVTIPEQASPYGVTQDGKPRRKPGPKPRANRSAPPGPRAAAPPRGRPQRAAGPDYAMAVAGLIQLPAAALIFAGQRKPELKADGYALGMHAGPISTAVSQLAQDQPGVAAALDKLMAVGPYGALIAAVSPLVLQILCNHSVIPAGAGGTLAKEDLISHYESVAA